jgi:hypothetical protein
MGEIGCAAIWVVDQENVLAVTRQGTCQFLISRFNFDGIVTIFPVTLLMELGGRLLD